MSARTTTAALLAVLLGAGAASPALATTKTVRVGSYYFEDDTAGDGRIVVDEGDRITFTFGESTPHSATVDELFDSGTHSGGQTYTTTMLTRAGTYLLYCNVHGPGR